MAISTNHVAKIGVGRFQKTRLLDPDLPLTSWLSENFPGGWLGQDQLWPSREPATRPWRPDVGPIVYYSLRRRAKSNFENTQENSTKFKVDTIKCYIAIYTVSLYLYLFHQFPGVSLSQFSRSRIILPSSLNIPENLVEFSCVFSKWDHLASNELSIFRGFQGKWKYDRIQISHTNC